MKTQITAPVGLFAWFAALTSPIIASEGWKEVRTFRDGEEGVMAPFFEGHEGGAVDGLPLKSTEVKVRISGTIAEVMVEQIYRNEGAVPLQARYVFPGSTRAAVHGLELRIGERVVVAEIQEKAEAAATYEEAKRKAQSAALLEQHRPNVFQMSVANIAPQSEVAVKLHYTETLAATERVYEFVYPTVVGPRYSDANGGTEAWATNPYLRTVEASGAARWMPTFGITVDVQAGMPLQLLTCDTHEADIQFLGADSARATLAAGVGGDRDFVLRYQLADKQVRSGLVLHQGEDDQYFWLTVQPPERVTTDGMPPREYVFVVDVSGSMGGYPLETAKALLVDLLAGLRPMDRFNVMLFASASEVLSEAAVAVTAANRSRALAMIERASGGGTELLPALKRCFELPGSEELSRSVVVITDGYVDCEPRAFDLVREQLGRANLFAFGIGTSVNRHLIEGLARMGQGEPFVVRQREHAAAMAKRFREYISSPVMTDVQVDFDGWETHAVEPLSIPDVFADRPVELLGKWTGPATGRVRLSGRVGGERVSMEFDVADAAAKGSENPALAALWARERVRTLSDYAGLSEAGADADEEEILELGLKHRLLTAYTSFVAVDKVVQSLGAGGRTVVQPLPLPAGVSAAAVGSGGVLAAPRGTAGTTPEPGRLLLMMVAALAAAWQRRRSR